MKKRKEKVVLHVQVVLQVVMIMNKRKMKVADLVPPVRLAVAELSLVSAMKKVGL